MRRPAVFRSLKIPDDKRIADLWIAPFGWAAVTAAIELGITETLSQGAKTIAQVAKPLNLQAECVESVLRVMVAMGFAQQKKNTFQLAADAKAYLVPSSPLGHLP